MNNVVQYLNNLPVSFSLFHPGGVVGIVKHQQHTGYLGYYVNYILRFAPLLNKIHLTYIGLRLSNLNFTSCLKINLKYIGFF